MKIAELLDNAIKMELDGYNFYIEAATRTASTTGRSMFNFLAEYELKHKRMLEALKDNKKVSAKDLELPLPKDSLKSLFADARANMDKSVPPTSDDIDALTFAMGKETESYDMYKSAAASATDPDVRAVFERLAVEENQHYEILENTRYYLKENATWSLWEEGGPIEG